jgi:hypothetical protein
VFLILYKYGTSPASFIGKMLWEERTNTYKILQALVREWFIAENIKWNVKHFFVANKEVLRNKIEEKKKNIERQELILPKIEQSLAEFDKEKISPIPKMRFFEWNNGIEELFKDIIGETKKKNYSTIKCISSNTLESLSINNKKLEDYTWDFFYELEKNKIRIESYLWTWVLTLEQMIQSYEVNDIKNLSVGNNSLNFFIVWEITYLLIFKQIPSGIKLESSEFSDLMHFMLKKM